MRQSFEQSIRLAVIRKQINRVRRGKDARELVDGALRTIPVVCKHQPRQPRAVLHERKRSGVCQIATDVECEVLQSRERLQRKQDAVIAQLWRKASCAILPDKGQLAQTGDNVRVAGHALQPPIARTIELLGVVAIRVPLERVPQKRLRERSAPLARDEPQAGAWPPAAAHVRVQVRHNLDNCVITQEVGG